MSKLMSRGDAQSSGDAGCQSESHHAPREVMRADPVRRACHRDESERNDRVRQHTVVAVVFELAYHLLRRVVVGLTETEVDDGSDDVGKRDRKEERELVA